MASPLSKIVETLTSSPEGLEGRDPEFIRRQLPRLWLIAQVYHRAEVEGFENVPDEPVLFVGNHSGGATVADSWIFMLAYNTFFTVEGRPMIGMAHRALTATPGIGHMLRKLGAVTAGHEAAEQVFSEGGSLLVYPGGDVEALRPTRDKNKLNFDGRKGFLKLAHANGVKIVPVVATGGQETLWVLNDGKALAKLMRFDKMLRIKSVPITFSMPWGFLPGGLPHFPFPAKIRMRVLEPIDLREKYGDDPDWDQAYAYVTSLMQRELSALAAKTVLPVLG
ncbi:glycerol acyltransferase [Nocardioides baekrokdamisoli]|uniref:Glycerol acyltransferase n=1 Tax=Nocardioides baekrokdamisoli TaxID=1804624 RepID=A0A3G9J1E5_9ACTN|nr:lysophospholipid acyltransferase family protein [Nocardioides baekrokdamisoli]BBH16789.1 glycerol acyltransferase [Nocardioides baekrokdamisoli]